VILVSLKLPSYIITPLVSLPQKLVVMLQKKIACNYFQGENPLNGDVTVNLFKRHIYGLDRFLDKTFARI
jgi:hypothetical protein